MLEFPLSINLQWLLNYIYANPVTRVARIPRISLYLQVTSKLLFSSHNTIAFMIFTMRNKIKQSQGVHKGRISKVVQPVPNWELRHHLLTGATKKISAKLVERFRTYCHLKIILRLAVKLGWHNFAILQFGNFSNSWFARNWQILTQILALIIKGLLH